MFRRLRDAARKRKASKPDAPTSPPKSADAGDPTPLLAAPAPAPRRTNSDPTRRASAEAGANAQPPNGSPNGAPNGAGGDHKTSIDAPPLPPANPERDEMNRRLSLDGDLPDSARRPDHDPAVAGAHEGLVRHAPGSVAARMDVAGCSEAGWEPAKPEAGHGALEVRKENQDAFAILAPFARHADLPALGEPDAGADAAAGHMTFLGVFDGHGAEGRPIAHFARDHIARVTLDIAARSPAALVDPANDAGPVARDIHRARMEALKAAFSRAERGLTDEANQIDHLFSGTTAVVAWLFRDDVYTAWAGDSRCIVGRAVSTADGATRYRPVDLSHDQKPSRADEKRRVKAAGGRIARWRRNIGPLRVWLPRDWIPGLAMTRSIGDTVLSEFGVSPVPEVTYTRLCAADAFMVLASDGVWEFMTSQEVVDFVGKMLAAGRSAAETSTALVKEAVRKWRRNEVVVDDTTAVVMHLRVDPPVEYGSEPAAAAGGSGVEPLPHSRRGGRMESSAIGKVVFGMGRANKGGRTRPSGTVLLVGEDGKLADFVCKNDVNTGA